MNEHFLCSEAFRQFFDLLRCEEGCSIEKCIEKIADALPIIADEISLGRVDISNEKGVVIFDPNVVQGVKTIFLSENGYEKSPMMLHYDTSQNKLVVVAYPFKGYHWNNEEFEQVKFLARFVKLVLTASILKKRAEDAEITDEVTKTLNMTGLIRVGEQLENKNKLSEYSAVHINAQDFTSLYKNAGTRNEEYLRDFCRRIIHFLLPDEKLGRIGGSNFIILIKKDRIERFLNFISNLGTNKKPPRADFKVGVYNINQSDDISCAIKCANSAYKKSRTQANTLILH